MAAFFRQPIVQDIAYHSRNAGNSLDNLSGKVDFSSLGIPEYINELADQADSMKGMTAMGIPDAWRQMSGYGGPLAIQNADDFPNYLAATIAYNPEIPGLNSGAFSPGTLIGEPALPSWVNPGTTFAAAQKDPQSPWSWMADLSDDIGRHLLDPEWRSSPEGSQLLERVFKYNGLGGDIDWRPGQMIPEDFY